MYNIAQASLEECRYYLILAKDLEYGDPGTLFSQSKMLARKLRDFIKSVEQSKQNESKAI